MIINRTRGTRGQSGAAHAKAFQRQTSPAPPDAGDASLCSSSRPFWRGLALALPLIAFGWIATLALVALFSTAAPARYVLVRSGEVLNALPEARLLGAGAHWLILASDDADFTRQLYRAGAILVLPAGLRGCAASPKIAPEARKTLL